MPWHFIEMAAHCGLNEDGAAVFKQIVEAAPDVIRNIENTLPAKFPAQVAMSILNGLAGALAFITWNANRSYFPQCRAPVQ